MHPKKTSIFFFIDAAKLLQFLEAVSYQLQAVSRKPSMVNVCLKYTVNYPENLPC